MKIDTDLRLAITAAERAQRNSHSMIVQEHYARLNTYLDVFIAGRHGPMLRRTLRELEDHGRRLNLLHARLARLGLQAVSGNPKRPLSVSDEKKFTRAGGMVPKPMRTPWRAADLIAELVAARPHLRDAILRRHGIDWT